MSRSSASRSRSPPLPRSNLDHVPGGAEGKGKGGKEKGVGSEAGSSVTWPEDVLYDKGFDKGMSKGKILGFEKGHSKGYDQGLRQGEQTGFDWGFGKGFAAGKQGKRKGRGKEDD